VADSVLAMPKSRKRHFFNSLLMVDTDAIVIVDIDPNRLSEPPGNRKKTPAIIDDVGQLVICSGEMGFKCYGLEWWIETCTAVMDGDVPAPGIHGVYMAFSSGMEIHFPIRAARARALPAPVPPAISSSGRPHAQRRAKPPSNCWMPPSDLDKVHHYIY
jgi:hypothetical protein